MKTILVLARLMVNGYWLMVIGYWLMVIGYWLLVIGYWLLVSSNAFGAKPHTHIPYPIPKNE
jgi:hypothetical protein